MRKEDNHTNGRRLAVRLEWHRWAPGQVRHEGSAGKVGAMDPLEALVRGLPGDAKRIRQRYWRDEKFRTVCEDYRDCLDAMSRFKSSDPPDLVKAEEYRELAAELLDEAIAVLRKKPP